VKRPASRSPMLPARTRTVSSVDGCTGSPGPAAERSATRPSSRAISCSWRIAARCASRSRVLSRSARALIFSACGEPRYPAGNPRPAVSSVTSSTGTRAPGPYRSRNRACHAAHSRLSAGRLASCARMAAADAASAATASGIMRSQSSRKPIASTGPAAGRMPVIRAEAWPRSARAEAASGAQLWRARLALTACRPPAPPPSRGAMAPSSVSRTSSGSPAVIGARRLETRNPRLTSRAMRLPITALVAEGKSAVSFAARSATRTGDRAASRAARTGRVARTWTRSGALPRDPLERWLMTRYPARSATSSLATTVRRGSIRRSASRASAMLMSQVASALATARCRTPVLMVARGPIRAGAMPARRPNGVARLVPRSR
jgi:hypothetical protein